MEQTFTITTAAKRTMFGKRTGQHVANLAPENGRPVLSVDAATATEAKAGLLSTLGAMAQHAYSRRYVFCGDGKTVLAVYYQVHGWAYDIIDPERSHPSGVMMNAAIGAAGALKAAIAHAESSYGGVVKVL